MASVGQESGSQNVQASNTSKDSNFMIVYKSLESTINDKNVLCSQKVCSLVTAWKKVYECLNIPGNTVDSILEWVHRQTLNLVLTGDWVKQTDALKDELLEPVKLCEKALKHHPVSKKLSKLKEIIIDPWGNVTLCKILNDPGECDINEAIKFFSSEHGYLVAVRLKKLCDSRCEDLALRFARITLKCLRLSNRCTFHEETSEDQKRYILDIYIALLHKFNRTQEILSELKALDLKEGLDLVRRFAAKRVELSRIWRHCAKIAELAAQLFIAAAMMKPMKEAGLVLADLLLQWVSLNDKLEGIEAVPKILRRIIQTADSAAHIYLCCEILNKKFGAKIKSFTIELYIRALTTDMNELEKQKTQSDETNTRETSKRLASGFLSLANLLQDHLGVSRECVLTSFSLNPTQSCLEKIEKLAIACGKTQNPASQVEVLDTGQQIDPCNQCRLSNSTEKCTACSKKERNSDCSVDALILIKGDAVTGSKNYDVLSAPNQVLDAEALGLSRQLCDDLAVVLSSPRYQLLSWVLDWKELKSTCEKYLSDAEGNRTRVKELKYLNIDYSQFKDWPTRAETQDTYYGIEKGYEQWVDEEDSIDRFEFADYNSSYDSDASDIFKSSGGRRRKAKKICSSDSEYEFPSCGRRKSRKICTSDSDYELEEPKLSLRNEAESLATSPTSDIDTASLDSRTDSLGSDGQKHSFDKTKLKKHNPKNSLSHFAMVTNHRRNETQNVISNAGRLNIFNRLEYSPKDLNSALYQNSAFMPFIMPEKRASDPTVLKSLRMYRPAPKKNMPPQNSIAGNILSRGKNELFDDKIANFTSKLLFSKEQHCRTKKDVLYSQKSNNITSKILLERLESAKNLNANWGKGYLHNSGNLLNPNTNWNLGKSTTVIDLSTKNNKYGDAMVTEVNMNPVVVLDRHKDLKTLCKQRNSCSDYEMELLNNICEGRVDPTNNIHASYKRSRNGFDCRSYPAAKITGSSKKEDCGYSAKRRKLDVLSNIPGMNSLEMVQPAFVDSVVNVVQISNNKQMNSQMRSVKLSSDNQSASSSVATNLVTSMPVTAHIQRIGQPRNQDKTCTTEESTSVNTGSALSEETTTGQMSNVTVEPPATTVSTPTLINILSQEIIKPAQNKISQSSSETVTQPRSSSALINILSQQIVKPANSTNAQPSSIRKLLDSVSAAESSVSKAQIISSTGNSSGQGGASASSLPTVTSAHSQNSARVVTSVSSQQQILNSFQQLLNSQGKQQNMSLLKGVNLVTAQGSSDGSRMVQFVCKSDGKMIQLTPYPATSNIKVHTVDAKKLSKNENSSKTSTTVSQSAGGNSIQASPPVSRAVYDESFTKFPKKALSDGEQSSDQHSTLPKFQQAFGKTVYQNNASVEVVLPGISQSQESLQEPTLSTTQTSTVSLSKSATETSSVKSYTSVVTTTKPVASVQSSTAPVNVQAVHGSVIYARQVPGTAGQTISIIPSLSQSNINRNQVFRIAPSSEQMTLVKDSVIRSKMSALLAAALQQGTVRQPTTSSASSFNQSGDNSNSKQEMSEIDSSSDESGNQNSVTQTPTLVTPMRITLPVVSRSSASGAIQNARILQIPGNIIKTGTPVRQQVVLTTAPVSTSIHNSKVPQTSCADSIISQNSMDSNVSSTTLEQLREFDLVLEQVKERSTTVQPNTNAADQQPTRPLTNISQDVQIDNTFQENLSDHAGNQRVNVTYMNQSLLGQKISACTPVVVVTTYSLQPAASPALSVTSQSSSSPCVTPAPSANVCGSKPVPKSSSKNSKSKSIKTATTHTSKASPVPKPQQKPQEDEQTTQRIYDILAEYAEQLRNSPDLNNKPAPRRRSNPPTNPSHSSKRKKISSSKKSSSSQSLSSELSPGADDPRTIGSEDSSCGVVQIAVHDSTSQAGEDHSVHGSDFSSIRVKSDSNDSVNADSHQQVTSTGRSMIFTETSTAQPRNILISETGGETIAKVSNATAVLVPGNYIMPVSMVKGAQPIAVVSGGSKILATVPTRSGQNMLLLQGFLNQTKKPLTVQQSIKPIKYSTIQSVQCVGAQNLGNMTAQPSVVIPSSNQIVVTQQNFQSSKEQPVHTLSGNNLLLTTNSKSEQTPNQSVDTGFTTTAIKTLSDEGKDVVKTVTPLIESQPSSQNLQKGGENTKCAVHKKGMTVLASEPLQPNDTGKKLVNSDAKAQLTKRSDDLQPVSTATVVTFTQIGHLPASEMDFQKGPLLKEKKNDERVQSVLVAVTSSNGPMLAQTGGTMTSTRITQKSPDSDESKTFSCNIGANYTYQNKFKKLHGNQKDKDAHQLLIQRKQAAIERELRLQKSLSEECEDLGVDEPSTSELFPEADLLFDANNSPSYDQLTQDASISQNNDKRFAGSTYQEGNYLNRPNDKSEGSESSNYVSPLSNDKFCKQNSNVEIANNSSGSTVNLPNLDTEQSQVKDAALMLFSDDDIDDNSNSNIRTDFLFEPLDYQQSQLPFDYDSHHKSGVLTNGSKEGIAAQSGTSTCSSYDDQTMTTPCAAMSDVTLSSPLQESFDVVSPPPVNKYRYKYMNKKKLLKAQCDTDSKSNATNRTVWQSDPIEASSGEDTSGSVVSLLAERDKSSASGSISPEHTFHSGVTKLKTSPSWDENSDNSASSYKSLVRTKILKVSMTKLDLFDKNVVTHCNSQTNKLDKGHMSKMCELNSPSPSSPLSPVDGDLGGLIVGRGSRRAAQIMKKGCPCCTSPQEQIQKRSVSSSRKCSSSASRKRSSSSSRKCSSSSSRKRSSSSSRKQPLKKIPKNR